MSRVGPHLGTCIRCNCHGHSDDVCDPETGECKVSGFNILHTCFFHLSSGQLLSVQSCFIWPDLFLVFYQTCQHNTGGFHCDKCLTGFYGNATIGKPSDCKACPCPMTSPPNRLAWKREAGHNLPCSFRYRTTPSYCFLEFLARYDTRL